MSKSRYRWYQIRLRAALFVFTLTAVALGIWSVQVRPYFEQFQLRTLISEEGGTIETRSGPPWLRSMLGEEYCQDIVLLNVAALDPSESMLNQVSRLRHLEVLVLGGETITEETLRFVPNAESLQAVVLDTTNVSDEAIARFRANRPGIYVARCDRRAIAEFQRFGFGTFEVAPYHPAPPPEVASRLAPAWFEETIALDSRGVTSSLRIRIATGPLDPTARNPIALIPLMPRLESLGLTGVFTSDEDMLTLGKFNSLRRLKFHQMKGPYSNELLACIAQHPNLQELAFDATPLTDDDLAALSDLTQVKSLHVSLTNVTDPSKWPDFPLEELRLESTFIEDDDVPALARYSNLRDLRISHTEITPAGLRELTGLAQLARLHLLGTLISYETYDVLCEFPSLKNVVLGVFRNSEGMIVNGWSIPSAAPGVKMAWPPGGEDGLEFDPATMAPDPERIAEVRANFQKRIDRAASDTGYLSLNIGEWYHLDLLENQAGITHLALDDSLATDADMAYIATMPDLLRLSLYDTWVSDEGLKSLIACPKLRTLNLAGTRVTDAGMESVAQMENLVSLTLPTQTVRGEGMRLLQQLRRLKFIHFEPMRGLAIPFARRRIAPAWTADDVAHLVELAKQLLPRLDANADGIVEMKDVEATFGKDWPNRIPAYAVFAIQQARTQGESAVFYFVDSLLEEQNVAPDAKRDFPDLRTGEALFYSR